MTQQPLTRTSRFTPLAGALRLALCLIGVFTLAFVQTTPAAVAGLAAALAVWFASAQAWRPLRARWLGVNFFLALVWLLTPWTTPGHSLWTWGPLNVTAEGLWLCLNTTVKCNAIFILFSALTADMSLSRFARAMCTLRCPSKLVTLFLLTARQIDFFNDARERLWQAALLRGFVPSASLRTYRTLAAMVGLIFVRAWHRSHVLSEALKLRHFQGHWPEHSYEIIRPSHYLLLVASGCSALVLLLFDQGFFL